MNTGSPSRFLSSLILRSVFTEDGPYSQLFFFFQHLLWKLCTEVCLIEQAEADRENWRDLFGIFGKALCCILCYKARFTLLHVRVMNPPNRLQICTLQPTDALFPPLNFKSYPEVFITLWSITHSNLESSVFLMFAVHLQYQQLSFSLFFP